LVLAKAARSIETELSSLTRSFSLAIARDRFVGQFVEAGDSRIRDLIR
jgi:hypothetical protein